MEQRIKSNTFPPRAITSNPFLMGRNVKMWSTDLFLAVTGKTEVFAIENQMN